VVNVPIGLVVLANALRDGRRAGHRHPGVGRRRGRLLDGGEGRAPDLLVALALLAAVCVRRQVRPSLGGIILPLLVVVSALSSVHTEAVLQAGRAA
jgi:hypothetical protein